MTPNDVLVQTRLPVSVAKWLKTRADLEGDSVAGALRRLAASEAARAIVPCWIQPENQADPQVIFGRGTLPHYHLRVLNQLVGGDVRFQLLSTNGRGISGDTWRSTGYFGTLNTRRFVLFGDHRPWKLVASWENLQTTTMEVTLRVDDYRAVAAVKVKDQPNGGGLVAVIYSDGDVRYGAVDRQHDAYHFPVPGERSFIREGWPSPPPEMIIAAMRVATP